MARPAVVQPAEFAFLPEVEQQLLARAERLRIDPPDIILAFFRTAIAQLPPSVRVVARFGVGANTWALVIGNYWLAAANNRHFGIVAMDLAAAPSPRSHIAVASAIGPVVYARYPLEFAPRITGPDFWTSYPDACELLLASRQGQSPNFLTSRVRTPLAELLINGDSTR